MKKFLLIFVVVFVNGLDEYNFPYEGRRLKLHPPPPSATERKSTATIEEYFSQKLDHYDPTNTVTWSQRYFVNDQHFDSVGRNVAFLMIGGESSASETWMTYGSWVASAKKYNAILFQLEHRYYGTSQPFPELTLENLRYLSSQQALADLATFIVAMNKEYQLSPDVKWILFGASYSASLAAWMREKYPHLVQGVMSASGPILAKMDYYEYRQVVADDLISSSQACADAVRIGVNQAESLLNSPSREVLNNLFNLCHPIEENLDNEWNLGRFFESITSTFDAIAQYNNIPGTITNIDDLCEIMTNKTIGTEVDRLSEIYKLRHKNCMNYNYNSEIQSLQNLTALPNGDRQWIYQTCTEFGWYQTTNQEVQVFGNRNPVDFFTRFCTEAFGETFNNSYIIEQTERTNMDYGALNIQTSNIVYVHGSFDPWHAAGLQKTTNPQSPVILINGTSHCANFYEESEDDLPQLTAARKEIDRLIGVWLGINSS